jgi:hypothetical protein
MRRLSNLVAALACVGAASSAAGAQAKGAAGSVGLGYTDVGATVGIGGLNGASASFGGRFEHVFKALPDMGNGLLGIQASAEYYSWSSGGSSSGFSYSTSIKYIPIGVTANYHFKLDEPKLDPFLGLGLGYNVVQCSYSSSFGSGSNTCGYSSGVYLIGKAGARYFFAPNMAAYGDVGVGAATLNLGLMFKVN